MVASNIRNLAAVICVAGSLMILPATAAEKSATDQDKLQGKWEIVSFAVEDTVVKKEDKSAAWKGTFEKDLFVEKDRFGQVGASNAKLTLDDTRVPKQITVQDDDGKLTFRGIYALDGDTLKVCMNGDGTDVRRPEAFVTKKGTPLILVTLKKRPAGK